MLTDGRIAEMLMTVNGIEREARQSLAEAVDQDEKDAALIAVRQSVALRKPLEKWVTLRACRAQRVATQ
jgi:hypothetical protein